MSLNNRYEFVLLFDVKDGNPNGDPDAGNLPRLDPETGMGLVTDVCLKRKVRNYVGIAKENSAPFEIYVTEKAILNNQHARAYTESDELTEKLQQLEEAKRVPKPKKGADETAYKEAQKLIKSIHHEDLAKRWVCDNFFDVRTFGAVMSTSDKNDEDDKSDIAKKAGQVRGPVQITFSRSIDPVVTAEHSLSVVAARKDPDKPGNKSIQEQIGIQGRKFTIPYALYRCHGFVSAHLADQTGFDAEDLELLWQALINMFDHDRSAARGEMSCRGLFVFKHESKLGNAPAHQLFDLITVTANNQPPRSFSDYSVVIDEQSLPEQVTLEKKVG
ncbi:type I-C CRISPR-associated protein Cas7/Csd2 [Ectothiorhodospiraceae bacterium BW-2]|nr:type I-C CRISPR-associated protein Cas7/Csd2 [Ectothiorhodospiraceae bacterium BW-2]